MKEILKLAQKAQRMKQEYIAKKGDVYMDVLDEAEQAYQNLFTEIMKGEPAKQGSSIEKEAIHIESRLKQITHKVMKTMSNELSVLDLLTYQKKRTSKRQRNSSSNYFIF